MHNFGMLVRKLSVPQTASPPHSCKACEAPYHMIDAEGVYATELQAARQGVPYDGRAQVPHMHLLGHIWRGEIHHHPPVGERGRPGTNALQASPGPAQPVAFITLS